MSTLLESENFQGNIALNESRDTWHCRLGHCGLHILSLLKRNKVLYFKTAVADPCTTCHLAKSYKLSFTLVEHCATTPLELIHFDVWQSTIISPLFYLYVILVDDFSRFTGTYPLK